MIDNSIVLQTLLDLWYLSKVKSYTMGDFPYVEWLARLYKKVGEFSGSWTDYIKVDTLSVFY